MTAVADIKIKKETDPDVTFRFTRVTVDAGYAEGVRPGMEFFIKHPLADSDRGRVLEVKEHTSEVELEQMYFSSEAPAPAVGWRLSTNLIGK